MNTYLAKNEGLRGHLENERLIKHCHDLLLKDFYIYRATDKLLDVFENEISFYESPYLELSNAIFIYELLNGSFMENKEMDYLRIAYEDSINDLAIHLSKSFRHGSSIEYATSKVLSLLLEALKVKDKRDRVNLYISRFSIVFPEITILNLKDIEKRLSLKEAACL